MELLFPLLLVALLVPMFLGVRRQKREAEKVNTMQSGLKVGDRVTTTSGLFGTVIDADDTTVDLEIAEDVVTTWLRASIRDIRTEDTDAAAEPIDADEAAAVDDAVATPELDSADGTAAAEGTAAPHTNGTTSANGTGDTAHGAEAGDAAADPNRLTKD
ncbi:preprotein translocase subunit YajC [Nocardia sp. alder85J]|uniref:preprotein translocase subunit YajC n=1 Tax=Nocardia sp. alder85J TaxID=2862949 RepID=UPI003A4DF7EC